MHVSIVSTYGEKDMKKNVVNVEYEIQIVIIDSRTNSKEKREKKMKGEECMYVFEMNMEIIDIIVDTFFFNREKKFHQIPHLLYIDDLFVSSIHFRIPIFFPRNNFK